MKRHGHIIWCFIFFCALALAIFALDALCQNTVSGGSKPLIPGVVSLEYAKNTGAAFSFLSGHPLLANVLSAVLTDAVAAFMLFGKMTLAARLSLGAVLTGGTCNLYMRLIYGGVNDWIKLEFMRFPLFNFADICICLGAALFAVFYLFAKENRENVA